MKTILSIDCGTQSLRVLIFGADGSLLAKEQITYEPYVSPGPGLAEQDPEIYWTSLIDACQGLKAREPVLFKSISGVGVTTQRTTMINVDKEGQALCPAIVWLDQRTARPVFGTRGPIKYGLKLAGLVSSVEKKLMDVQAQAKCNWIIQNEPEIWKNTHKYLQVSGFLNFRLTNRFADAMASQIGHLPFDYKRRRWAGPLSLTRRVFPVPRKKLPKLIQPGDILGQVTQGAADLTGLPQGIPVVACGSDKGCETLGSGVIDQTMISLSFGTTATVQTTSSRYFEAIPLMPPFPAAIPGYYNPEVEIFRGFWMISWFKKQFAQKEVETANAMGIAPEELLNQCLERTPPGAMGLIVQPYWGPGLDHPNAKGAMIGFGDVHTKDHVYRAMIEGLGFALLEGMERIQARGKVAVKQAALSGGASQSDAICQIAADIFNLPMKRAATHETSGLGAAVLTAKGVGIHPSVKEAVTQMTGPPIVPANGPASQFEPNPDNVALYKELYERVYKNMYQALSPLYTHIQEITGYPEK